MLRSALLALAAVAVLAPSAHATTIDFEAGALAADTPVRDQFAAAGVTFSRDTGSLPRITTATPRSPSRALNLVGSGEEFPQPRVEGRFDRVRSTVSLFVRSDPSTSPGFAATATLIAFAADGTELGRARSDLPAGGSFRELTVSTGTPNIAYFRVSGDDRFDQGEHLAIDDLTFDDPVDEPGPALGLRVAPARVQLVQGGTAETFLELQRLNGARGPATLRVERQPPGVFDRLDDSQLDDGERSTRLTFRASPDARLGTHELLLRAFDGRSSEAEARLTVEVVRAEAALSTSRVTQGLEHDLRARVAYDLIAGKDTAVRFLVSSPGTRGLEVAECLVREPDGREQVFPAVWNQPLVDGRSEANPRNGTPIGHHTCWVPGSAVEATGDRQVRVRVRLVGQDDQVLDLGTHRFLGSRDLKVLVLPWLLHGRLTTGAVDPDARPFDAAMRSAVARGLTEANRMLPIRSGIGPILQDVPAGARAAGLRFEVRPPYQCDERRVPGMGVRSCDAASRAEADHQIWWHNVGAGALRFFGRPADDFDFGLALAVVADSRGGQSCWGGMVTAGAALDTKDPGYQGSLFAHELSHCPPFGQTRRTSPNSRFAIDRDGGHSQCDLASTGPLVNTVTRTDEAGTLNLMCPTISGDRHTFHGGFEWNAFRRELEAQRTEAHLSLVPRARAASTAPRAAQAAPAARRTMFQVVGTLDLQRRTATVLHSARVSERGAYATPPAAEGGAALVLRSRSGRRLARVRIDASGTGDDGKASVVPFFVTVPLDEDAASAEVVLGTKRAVRTPFSAAAPRVSGVRAAVRGGRVTVRWRASDRDSRRLTASVYEVRGREVTLVQSGVRARRFAYTPTEKGAVRLRVEVSDGFNVTRRTARAVRVR